MDQILNDISIWWNDGNVFTKNVLGFLTVYAGSNGEGDGNDNVKRNEPNK